LSFRPRPAAQTTSSRGLIGQWLSEHLGQPVIIENRPGAGTNLATEVIVRAPPDGYTLFSAGPASAINATLYDKLSFNFLRDTAPVAGIMRVSNVWWCTRRFQRGRFPIHRLRQGQSWKTQHGVGRHRQRVPYGRRTVQDDGGR
jgi:hypothetical protein